VQGGEGGDGEGRMSADSDDFEEGVRERREGEGIEVEGLGGEGGVIESGERYEGGLEGLEDADVELRLLVFVGSVRG
jgi:hypothetical protein